MGPLHVAKCTLVVQGLHNTLDWSASRFVFFCIGVQEILVYLMYIQHRQTQHKGARPEPLRLS